MEIFNQIGWALLGIFIGSIFGCVFILWDAVKECERDDNFYDSEQEQM